MQKSSFLPRQARDKHRGNSKRHPVLSDVHRCGNSWKRIQPWRCGAATACCSEARWKLQRHASRSYRAGRARRNLRGLHARPRKRDVVRQQNGVLFWSFPYVCPEPVLVKCSFLYIIGSNRPFCCRYAKDVYANQAGSSNAGLWQLKNGSVLVSYAAGGGIECTTVPGCNSEPAKLR